MSIPPTSQESGFYSVPSTSSINPYGDGGQDDSQLVDGLNGGDNTDDLCIAEDLVTIPDASSTSSERIAKLEKELKDSQAKNLFLMDENEKLRSDYEMLHRGEAELEADLLTKVENMLKDFGKECATKRNSGIADLQRQIDGIKYQIQCLFDETRQRDSHVTEQKIQNIQCGLASQFNMMKQTLEDHSSRCESVARELEAEFKRVMGNMKGWVLQNNQRYKNIHDVQVQHRVLLNRHSNQHSDAVTKQTETEASIRRLQQDVDTNTTVQRELGDRVDQLENQMHQIVHVHGLRGQVARADNSAENRAQELPALDLIAPVPPDDMEGINAEDEQNG